MIHFLKSYIEISDQHGGLRSLSNDAVSSTDYVRA
jgi:hypothetical protein